MKGSFTLIDWVKRNIFTTEGRLNRLKYLKYTLLWSFGNGVFLTTVIVLLSKITGSNEGFLLDAFDMLIMFWLGIGNLMLNIRRCHDLNMNGAFALLCVLPLINVLFTLYLVFAKGTVGWNKYGADPLLRNE